MTTQAEHERWNAKWSAFDVQRFDRNRGKYVPIPGQRYERVQDALAAASRLESGKRYVGQMLFVDVAT